MEEEPRSSGPWSRSRERQREVQWWREEEEEEEEEEGEERERGRKQRRQRTPRWSELRTGFTRGRSARTVAPGRREEVARADRPFAEEGTTEKRETAFSAGGGGGGRRGRGRREGVREVEEEDNGDEDEDEEDGDCDEKATQVFLCLGQHSLWQASPQK